MYDKEQLLAIFEKYNKHPDFDGVSLNKINQLGFSGDAIIHLAARGNDLKTIPLLIENGEDVNLQGDCGHTALQYACKWENLEMVRILLIYQADPFIKNEWGENALDAIEKCIEPKKKKIMLRYIKNRHRIALLY